MSEETILVVEDNEAMRQAIQMVLETDGFRVVTAINGASALQKMRGENLFPDLIVSDIAMPEMDGYEFFEKVRSQPEWVTIPFVFLTARGSREDLFEGKKIGAEDYLVKPVSRQDLIITVRSRLLRNQQILLAQLENAYQLSLIMLSNAIESRDNYSRGHIERVMAYSLAIARQMQLTETHMKTLQLGSILHDIGKILIGEHIFRKTGPLSEENWVEIRQHPVTGVELIKNISYLVPAIPVILYHHERWDGQGYPYGLSGEQIPITARIVAVAESLDALTTPRVYRKACTPQQAYQLILLGRGSQYDPAVVDAFQATWEEISAQMQPSHPAQSPAAGLV